MKLNGGRHVCKRLLMCVALTDDDRPQTDWTRNESVCVLFDDELEFFCHCYPTLPGDISILGLSILTTFIGDSHVLPCATQS
jgi:hypothetical protein